MRKTNKPAANNPAIQKLKAAKKKKAVIKAINTKPEDWVNRQKVMEKFGFSLRTMQYYHDRGIFPYAMLNKRIFYYLPGILQILEQTLIY